VGVRFAAEAVIGEYDPRIVKRRQLSQSAEQAGVAVFNISVRQCFDLGTGVRAALSFPYSFKQSHLFQRRIDLLVDVLLGALSTAGTTRNGMPAVITGRRYAAFRHCARYFSSRSWISPPAPVSSSLFLIV
jgi:hypothetical protein